MAPWSLADLRHANAELVAHGDDFSAPDHAAVDHDAATVGVSLPTGRIKADPVAAGGGGITAGLRARGYSTGAIIDSYDRYVGLPSNMALPDNPDAYPGMVYASGGAWFDSDGDGSWDWRGLGQAVFGKETTSTIERTFDEIVVTARRTVADWLDAPRRNPADRAVNASVTAERAMTNGSIINRLFGFDTPSVTLNNLASNLPSLGAGMRAQMQGGDPMQVEIARARGIRNYTTQGVGNMALGIPETAAGFSATAVLPPLAAFTELSSSQYVRSGGRAGLASSPYLGMAGEAFVAARLAAPVGATKGVSSIADDAFVRFDPTPFDGSIDAGGIQSRYFSDGKVWLTKYRDIKNITNASDLDTVLYRKNLWPVTQGKFDQGATLRVINNVNGAIPSGVTNMTNGVRQWHITNDIDPSNTILLYRIK